VRLLGRSTPTRGVGGAEPEDGQVTAQLLDLAAEEGGVSQRGVARDPDQRVLLELGRHDLVLLHSRSTAVRSGSEQEVEQEMNRK